MKKLGKSSKKGFTLVELIVVLVILAVLAAMLVPALVGYIDKAKAEKEYQTASTVYAAAQAVITEAYGKNDITSGSGLITKDGFKAASTDTSATLPDYGAEVLTLAGVDSGVVTDFTFNYGKKTTTTGGTSTTTGADYVINGGSVTIDGSKYDLTISATGTPSWSAAKVKTTTP